MHEQSGRLNASPTPVEQIASDCLSIRAPRLTLRLSSRDRATRGWENPMQFAVQVLCITNISGIAVCQAVALHYLYAEQRKGLRAALWVHATKWLRLASALALNTGSVAIFS